MNEGQVQQDNTVTPRKRSPETGHARNIGSFEQLISLLSVLNEQYHPANENISLKALQQKLETAKRAFHNAIEATTAINNAENQRSALFRPLRKFSTRIVNAFISCGASELSVKDAQSINRKMQGARSRASTIRKDAIQAGEIEGTISSASQQGIDHRLKHFKALYMLVSSHKEYRPYEAELHVNGLQQLEQQLEQSNTAYMQAKAAYSKARKDRDHELYHETDGLISLARLAKAYTKSVLGAGSPGYKPIGKLPFRVSASRA